MVKRCNKVIKLFIFVFNFLFFLTGCGLLGLGIWLNVEQDEWEGISDFNYISVGNIGIVVGTIIALISFLGCCGTITENKYMLLAFFTVLVIIFILEMGAGIAAYVMRGEIKDELMSQLNKRIPENYYQNNGINKAMNAVQNEFDCCGVSGITDWNKAINGKREIHESCCKDSASNCKTRGYTTDAMILESYNQGGCFAAIEKLLLYVGITGIVLALFQILDTILVMKLYCSITRRSTVFEIYRTSLLAA